MSNPRKSKIPHSTIGNFPVHITYRLAGSIPQKVIQELSLKRETQLQQLKATYDNNRTDMYDRSISSHIFKINAAYELSIDDYLHKSQNGPYHLANTDTATVVLDSWKFLHEKESAYVYVVCVMSNHVHVVLRAPDNKPLISPGKLMQQHKSWTAGYYNQLIGKTDTPFWSKGYFDRTVRKGRFETVMWYVLNNPVKAGLVNNWKQWPNTWLNPNYDLLFT